MSKLNLRYRNYSKLYRFKYLINAVDSVLNQDYKNLEIIIINDGSDEDEYYNHKFPKM